MQDPIVSSQIPWFEQRPSSGQSNSVEMKISCLKSYLIIAIERKIISLEQSRPCLPGSHVHSPTLVSQNPALLQSAGHFSSKDIKKRS